MVRKLVLLVGIVVIVGGVYAYKKGAIKKGEDGTIQIDTQKIKQAAAKDAKKLDDMDPYAKGDWYFSVFKYDKALAAYKEGLKKDPKNPGAEMAYYRIGQCYRELKQNAKAVKAYKTYKKKYPNGKMVPQAEKWIMVLGG